MYYFKSSVVKAFPSIKRKSEYDKDANNLSALNIAKQHLVMTNTPSYRIHGAIDKSRAWGQQTIQVGDSDLFYPMKIYYGSTAKFLRAYSVCIVRGYMVTLTNGDISLNEFFGPNGCLWTYLYLDVVEVSSENDFKQYDDNLTITPPEDITGQESVTNNTYMGVKIFGSNTRVEGAYPLVSPENNCVFKTSEFYIKLKGKCGISRICESISSTESIIIPLDTWLEKDFVVDDGGIID